LGSVDWADYYGKDNGCFFKFGVEVGVEESIVNALYGLRITDELFKSYAFIRAVRSQLTLQRQLRRQIKKKKTFIHIRVIINDCLIAVGVGGLVECAASFIT
jgi:hypothetical protein